jgi:two-component system phosphate regulon sensor histidine kinase PhoR
LQSSGLERRAVQLSPLVEAVVAQLHADALAKEVEVSVEVSVEASVESGATLPAVLGHADRLKQVFLNLLDNSIKYARPGDRVTVTLAGEAGAVACAVCDTGPGIAEEHLPHVTRRFYRAVPSGMPGSGLGLALAAEIVRQHGSHLMVESRTGSQSTGEKTGTCVRFVLPAWNEAEGA